MELKKTDRFGICFSFCVLCVIRGTTKNRPEKETQNSYVLLIV